MVASPMLCASVVRYALWSRLLAQALLEDCSQADWLGACGVALAASSVALGDLVAWSLPPEEWMGKQCSSPVWATAKLEPASSKKRIGLGQDGVRVFVRLQLEVAGRLADKCRYRRPNSATSHRPSNPSTPLPWHRAPNGAAAPSESAFGARRGSSQPPHPSQARIRRTPLATYLILPEFLPIQYMCGPRIASPRSRNVHSNTSAHGIMATSAPMSQPDSASSAVISRRPMSRRRVSARSFHARTYLTHRT